MPSKANALEFCLGSLQEMREGDVLESIKHYGEQGKIAYVHFRNVRGKVPLYQEVFVDEGDLDMLSAIQALREVGYDGVIIPDHTPEMSCDAPWHAGMAFALGYMRAALQMSERGVRGTCEPSREPEREPRALSISELELRARARSSSSDMLIAQGSRSGSRLGFPRCERRLPRAQLRRHESSSPDRRPPLRATAPGAIRRPPRPQSNFMMPMRDGTRMATDIYRPARTASR